jgi:hypothetical protein
MPLKEPPVVTNSSGVRVRILIVGAIINDRKKQGKQKATFKAD